MSVGENVSTLTSGDTTISHWVTSKPIRNASFNIGRFKEHVVNTDAGLPINVLMSEKRDPLLEKYLFDRGFAFGKDMEKYVGDDMASSIAFFTKMYGENQIPKFYATEISYSHGEAFPGLIHLAWETFQLQSYEGEDQIFRAHEVAHQWWGIGVDFKTYHDQWISEGFSDYSGAWYMQVVLNDNKKFFKQLEEWKKAILKNRKYLFHSDQEAGPVWLGYRTESSSTRGDYSLIVYKKGAWVLHMLRNLLLDWKTMKDDRFVNMMRDFYSRYAEKEASSQDFQQVVEEHVNSSMQWFFNQWLYRIKIPTYKFAYKVTETPEGKFKVRCRVKQENVDDDFQMIVPLLIDFGKDQVSRVRVMVNNTTNEFDLPPLPLEPKKIVFNDLESVLCEVDYEGW
ncbi:MAG: hypothetical protein HYY49_13115 [Ignavibacteriales bacterium]|nr:hypothetical protein [Ignavibacteriales bacterium]